MRESVAEKNANNEQTIIHTTTATRSAALAAQTALDAAKSVVTIGADLVGVDAAHAPVDFVTCQYMLKGSWMQSDGRTFPQRTAVNLLACGNVSFLLIALGGATEPHRDTSGTRHEQTSLHRLETGSGELKRRPLGLGWRRS